MDDRGESRAAVVWGTGFLWPYTWVGDAFLRQIWFSAALIGVSCLRRGHAFAAGALLATSAGVRLFPAVFVAGYAVFALRRYWEARVWSTPRESEVTYRLLYVDFFTPASNLAANAQDDRYDVVLVLGENIELRDALVTDAFQQRLADDTKLRATTIDAYLPTGYSKHFIVMQPGTAADDYLSPVKHGLPKN